MNALQLFNKYFKIVALGAIVVLGLLFARSLSRNADLSRENAKLKQSESILSNNLIAANDSMEFWKDKYGNSLSEIKILTGTNAMLEKEYVDLHNKYLSLLGKDAKNQEMIAYLQTQILLKDSIISELTANPGSGSYILNDSTLAINEGKVYDSNNYYNVNGKIITRIENNAIKAGTINLVTTVGLGVEFGISRDKKTGIASVTSKTAFPAKISMSGITSIESELNKKPSSYVGLGFVVGYGATLEKQPLLKPYIGLAAYVSPRWLTIKIRNR